MGLTTWLLGYIPGAAFWISLLRWVARMWIKPSLAWWRRYGALAVTVALIALLMLYGLTSGKVGWKVKLATLALVGAAEAMTWCRRLRAGLGLSPRPASARFANPS